MQHSRRLLLAAQLRGHGSLLPKEQESSLKPVEAQIEMLTASYGRKWNVGCRLTSPIA